MIVAKINILTKELNEIKEKLPQKMTLLYGADDTISVADHIAISNIKGFSPEYLEFANIDDPFSNGILIGSLMNGNEDVILVTEIEALLERKTISNKNKTVTFVNTIAEAIKATASVKKAPKSANHAAKKPRKKKTTDKSETVPAEVMEAPEGAMNPPTGRQNSAVNTDYPPIGEVLTASGIDAADLAAVENIIRGSSTQKEAMSKIEDAFPGNETYKTSIETKFDVLKMII